MTDSTVTDILRLLMQRLTPGHRPCYKHWAVPPPSHRFLPSSAFTQSSFTALHLKVLLLSSNSSIVRMIMIHTGASAARIRMTCLPLWRLYMHQA